MELQDDQRKHYKQFRPRRVSARGLRSSTVAAFQAMVFDYYRDYGRDFPWRRSATPYQILVSEFMLQQTQAPRVVDHFERFLGVFPELEDLAKAPRKRVISHWQGLGYNRRAINLHETAKRVLVECSGRVPRDPAVLREYPGIGAYTSCSIPVFAYGASEVLIETNIRAVVIYYFQRGVARVSEEDIRDFVTRILPDHDTDCWYNALMDLGTLLKKEQPSLHGRSALYARQSQFKGSRRELRGNLLRLCSDEDGMTPAALSRQLERPKELILSVLQDLEQEGFIQKQGRRYYPYDE